VAGADERRFEGGKPTAAGWLSVVAYLPRAVRSVLGGWRATRGHAVPGAGWRGTLLAAAVGGGAALALTLLPTIAGWHGGGHG
jgi:hypothetical protein